MDTYFILFNSLNFTLKNSLFFKLFIFFINFFIQKLIDYYINFTACLIFFYIHLNYYFHFHFLFNFYYILILCY